jgi:hypothetical protein
VVWKNLLLLRWQSFCIAVAALFFSLIPVLAAEESTLPALPEVLASPLDLWGDAALRQTNGPSFDFFAQLLPPLRYVNADFRDYPIVLSAPRSAVKARLISNGSAINARGGTRTWNDAALPVTFRVGPDELRFGEYPDRLSEPRYVKGHMPIVQIRYEHGESIYEEECFAALEPELATRGVVFVRFSLASGSTGTVAAQIEARNDVKPLKGSLLDENGEALAWYDNNWKWVRQRLIANISSNSVAVLAIATRPMDRRLAPLTTAQYDESRRKSLSAWETILQTGMQVDVPEPVVSNAWRATLIGSVALVQSNRLHASAGNQSEKLLTAEGCDATEALLLWGQSSLARELIPALLSSTRKGLEFQQAGQKLQLLTRYFWLTRDTDFLNAQAPKWSNELQLILGSRTNTGGLLPREQYSADVVTPVLSLNANAKSWRALRDFVPVLTVLGRSSQAELCRSNAAAFRASILTAVEKSERKDFDPPFIPNALLGDEEPPDVITSAKLGGFWNIMANYVLGARPFGLGSPREDWLLNYVERHGGLCMGLIRSRPASAFWSGSGSLTPLYGARRVSALLERDESDKALVAFYGMLAQGMTRETFIGGEGCSLKPLDSRGRQFYCPPNSTANAFFLTMLRQLLVQDVDLDDDGEPETLRLLFATPRAWLDDQKTIRVERAPTAFGPVSVVVTSQLERGEITGEIEMPRRLPLHTFLRLRLPEGWRIVSAQSGDRKLRLDDQGTTELVGLLGKVPVRFAVERNSPRPE